MNRLAVRLQNAADWFACLMLAIVLLPLAPLYLLRIWWTAGRETWAASRTDRPTRKAANRAVFEAQVQARQARRATARAALKPHTER